MDVRTQRRAWGGNTHGIAQSNTKKSTELEKLQAMTVHMDLGLKN